MKLDAIVKPDY